MLQQGFHDKGTRVHWGIQTAAYLENRFAEFTLGADQRIELKLGAEIRLL